MLRRLVALLIGLVVGLSPAVTTTASPATSTYDTPAIARVDAHQLVAAEAGQAYLGTAWQRSALAVTDARGRSTTSSAAFVATEAAGLADDGAGLAFRSDTTHIFRNAGGHLAEDTAANRALIQSAIDPANLRATITLPDGATLARYFRTLPDGTQVWAQVRNGIEITNGGLNASPR